MPVERSAGAIIFRKEKGNIYYLLLHYEAGHWDFPKGNIEKGEKSEETAQREIKEETGLEIIPEKILNSWDLIEESRQISGVIYLCKIKSGVITLSDEHCEYDWFTTDDLSKLYPEFANRLTSLELV